MPFDLSRGERIEEAAHEMLRLVHEEQGEYPDFVFRLTQRYHITAEELQEAYDSFG